MIRHKHTLPTHTMPCQPCLALPWPGEASERARVCGKVLHPNSLRHVLTPHHNLNRPLLSKIEPRSPYFFIAFIGTPYSNLIRTPNPNFRATPYSNFIGTPLFQFYCYPLCEFRKYTLFRFYRYPLIKFLRCRQFKFHRCICRVTSRLVDTGAGLCTCVCFP